MATHAEYYKSEQRSDSLLLNPYQTWALLLL